MGIQALGPELAIEGLDEGIVGRFAGLAEVQHDALLIGPQVEVAGDELRALVDPDGLRIADPAAYMAPPDNKPFAPGDRAELILIDRYWRAANYLSVGQIYLLDNPLLREQLKPEHTKPRLLGHWGTTTGLN